MDKGIEKNDINYWDLANGGLYKPSNEIIKTIDPDLELAWSDFKKVKPNMLPKPIAVAPIIQEVINEPVTSIIEPVKDFMQEFEKEMTQHTNMVTERDLNGFDICGAFKIQTANQSINEAKNKPIPKRLFGDYWFEGELSCLFASSNTGKSFLSVQICDAISRGISIKGIPMEALKQPVLYFDFELSNKQFEGRYSENYTNHYVFDEGFKRGYFDPNMTLPDHISFEEYLNNSIESTIEMTGAKVLIIDNITYLRNDTEKGKDALSLMKYLKALKSKYELSILVLAHTPKRDLSKPLTINDLSGSSNLGNFFDSIFSIGASTKDKSMRYIKQIKVRECEKKYDAENVINCQMVKYSNFVEFEFVDFGNESSHLKEVSEKDSSDMVERIVQLHSEQKSYRDIGRELGISHMKVKRILEKRLP